MGKPISYTFHTCNGEKKLAACVTIKVHTHLVLMKQLLKRCSKPLLVVPTDPVMLMVKNLISHTLLCGEPLQLQLLQHITEDDKHWFCCRMLDRITDDKIYLTRTSLGDKMLSIRMKII
jgi:hypothetical protein